MKLLNRKNDKEKSQHGLNIQVSMEGIDGDTISRLESLIESKESLIMKALGTDSLLLKESDGKLEFDWFRGEFSADEAKAYMNFVSALVKVAKESKRITAKDKPVENEKYAFRCFLLKLGFIGDEYKMDRKILLKNFTGSSAFKRCREKECAIPNPKNSVKLDMKEAKERLKDPQVQEEIKAILKGKEV